MGDIAKIFQNYLYRDLNYIVGGGCVVISFLYAFNRFLDPNTPLILYLFAVGICYIIGYALQDFFSIFRIVTTGFVEKPPSILKWLYHRFTGQRCYNILKIDKTQANKAIIVSYKNEGFRLEYERLVSLFMICTTMSPCLFVSSYLLFYRYWNNGKEIFDLMLSLTSLFFSIVFYILAWIKAAQHTQQVADAINEFEKESDILLLLGIKPTAYHKPQPFI